MTNISELPLKWENVGTVVCEDGWGCQDMLMIVENGEKNPVSPKPDSHPVLCRAVTSPCASLPAFCVGTQKTLSSHSRSCPSPAGAIPAAPSGLLSSLSPLSGSTPPGPWGPDGHPGLPPSLAPGPQLFLVVIKGCTLDDDHDVRVTQHREGPGLSVISYTHVCRQEDLCNNLPNTVPLWAPHHSTGTAGGGEERS